MVPPRRTEGSGDADVSPSNLDSPQAGPDAGAADTTDAATGSAGAHPASQIEHGMRGRTGSLSGASLLQQLQRNGSSGTLALRSGGGVALHLLADGELRRSVRIGDPDALEATEQEFRFDPHPAGDSPQLAPLFQRSRVPALRALPSFGPAQPVAPGLTDLRRLLERLLELGFGGSLRLAHGEARGLALVQNGRVVAAWYERDDYRLDRNDALRAIYRYSLEADNPPLLLEPLHPAVLASLLGLATAQPSTDPNRAAYTGLEADERGYHYFDQGERVLHVPAELVGTARRYRRLESDRDALLPELELPDDPPGWEENTYALTLRGQDAVNPMTDVAMRFHEEYGPMGRRILDALGRGASIEKAAGALGLDLQEFKPWLRRLEEDGLVRVRERGEGGAA